MLWNCLRKSCLLSRPASYWLESNIITETGTSNILVIWLGFFSAQ